MSRDDRRLSASSGGFLFANKILPQMRRCASELFPLWSVVFCKKEVGVKGLSFATLKGCQGRKNRSVFGTHNFVSHYPIKVCKIRLIKKSPSFATKKRVKIQKSQNQKSRRGRLQRLGKWIPIPKFTSRDNTARLPRTDVYSKLLCTPSHEQNGLPKWHCYSRQDPCSVKLAPAITALPCPLVS